MAKIINTLLQSYLTKFTQIGIVVGDAEKMAETYAKEFGLGPWKIYYRKGENGEVKYVVAKGVIDGIEFKFIQSNVPGDIFSAEYDKYGNGFHHLTWSPDYPEKYDAVMNILHEHGYKVLLEGELEGGVKYSFHKTNHDFCCTMEIIYAPEGTDGYGEPDKVIEATGEQWLGRMGQVGFAAQNAHTIARNFINVFNCAPWGVKKVPENAADPAWIPRGFMGDIDFELIQPSVLSTSADFHTRFMEWRGQGPDHLCYYPETPEGAKEACRRFKEDYKCETLLEVEFPGGVICAYFDTTELMGYVSEIAYFPPNVEGYCDPYKVYNNGCVVQYRIGPEWHDKPTE